MVLQDLGDAYPDNSGDDSSQNDPYASSSTPGRRFDSSEFPRPIPLVSPFLGFSEGVVRFKTEQTIKFAELKVHRSLTPPEAQALAYHLYKLEQSKSYFAVAGISGGAWRWWATMAEFRYPFYKPKPEDVNPNKFLFIKGPFAQTARHSWRLVVYTFVAGQIGKLLGQVIAQPVAARDTAADPALSQFSNDLKGAMSTDVEQRRESTAKMRAEWEEKRRQRAESRGDFRNTKTSPTHSDEDMSPSTGTDAWPSNASDSFSNSESSSQDESQNRQFTQRYQQVNARDRRPAQRPDDDDASPTGGLFQDEVQNQSTSGESSWERLRRGAGPAPGQRTSSRRSEPPHREQREGSTIGDSFTFAESDGERKFAQEKAQREFDERLERERQGKDFNEERRW